MGRLLLLLALVGVMLMGGPAPAQQSGRIEAASTEGALVLAARRHPRKRFSRADWCSKMSNTRQCKFCTLTYYGYCQCEYDFPCM
jgi:hypothetical protein